MHGKHKHSEGLSMVLSMSTTEVSVESPDKRPKVSGQGLAIKL